MDTQHPAGIQLPLWLDWTLPGPRLRVNPNKRRLLLTLISINFLFIIYWNWKKV